MIVNLLGKLFWSKILVTDCQSRRCNLLLSNWQFYLPRLSCEEICVLQQECFQKVWAPIRDWIFSQFYPKNNHCKESKTSSHRRNISRISRHCPSLISNHVQTFTTIFFLSFSRWLQASSKQESGLSLIEPGVSLRGEVRCPTNFFGWKKLAISAKNIPRRKQYGSQLKTKTYQFRFAE